ncbi:MAG TPA: nucleotidyltransferase family protein [Methyloprofundus sp.]|uniref:N-acetylmuramate alpha-1-phosphate uridylyltransferase MurU n=1 Tax=Methyloprofundus sp. TaxID=2020875 RepID=UPI0017D24AE5|nr:nucleotidyltransferase family protein [Methyloprofundus sp.]MBT5223164.1 nucleotidyltransferase family protein [Gammaproteobacteria bacterium]HIL78878.1 nucleotidyltransferase family protein [Methylococcales bacterium]MBT5824701.1 nucleotidyltransferase family protein [Gammaproteobacteria bacterium]MBT5967332.1 nucleotidyltransferase family protein [Gammaproteobacteria bacterium]MBT6421236.1 nucleotidyltransferase family protein [Gammaproteobacteria bacterium]
MKAMILAAGRGERMRPLTDHTPKPLLQAAGKALIVYTIEALVKAGITDIIINLAHLGEQIRNRLGDGAQYQANISYTHEGASGLETAGGIKNALPLLGDSPFLVVNGDISCDYNFHNLLNKEIALAHLILVNNPAHHPTGDFALKGQAILSPEGEPKYTYSGIGLYHPDLFASINPGKSALAPLLKNAMQENRITGELHPGFWMDIGTPSRLNELSTLINHSQSVARDNNTTEASG